MDEAIKLRCHMLSDVVGYPKEKSKREHLTQTAKSALLKLARENLFGYQDFEGNKYTGKGNELEDVAINGSGVIRGLNFHKNELRLENDFISGECDIYIPSRKLIIDTKCTWSIKTHPFFEGEGLKKVAELGYEWQMQGYMWLYGCDFAEVDFWLFPCPESCLTSKDDPYKVIELVNSIPFSQRHTTVVIERKEDKIAQIAERVEKCQTYYASIVEEFMNRTNK